MPPALLVSGPRETGKTVAVCHRIMRHLWETDGGRVGIIGKTIKNVKEAGVVRDFTDFVIPEWLRANLTSENGSTFAYTTKDTDGNLGPKVDGSTKTWYFRVRNYWGGESELMLYSLDHDADVEDKLKNTRFSCIYFPELDRFKDFRVFMVSYHQLRMFHLKPEQHLWIADTNPAEEGSDHFAYRIFYETEKLIAENPDDAELYRNVRVIEMNFEDNPWLTEARIKAIKALYRHDQDMWNRYVEGKWVRFQPDGTFSDVFVGNVHTVGDASAKDEKDWEIIIPEENTTELISGWDMGDVNHSIHILCKRLTKAADSPQDQEYAYDVIDDLIFIKQKVSLEALTLAFLERKAYWEEKLKELYNVSRVRWRHWSDQSAWHYRAAIDAYDELIVRRTSLGEINLQKSMIQLAHSVKKRARMIRKLLFDNRLYISARCHGTIDMLKNMKDLSQDGIYKHAMDSLSYPLAAEEPRLLEMQLVPKTRTAGRIINVGAR